MKKVNISYHHQLRLRPTHLSLILLLALPAALQAAPNASPATSGTPKPAQPPASSTGTDVIEREVYATRDQAGKFVLDHEEINMAPSPTGTINEALRSRSSIQFDLNSRNSMTGGDIHPPRISIRGARHTDSNFLIDGVSNNNNMNPNGYYESPGDGANIVPGGEAQAIFLDPDLLGSLTIYTSNIPVEYGDFTGGVIDAKIRDPRTDGFHGSIKYRYTSDHWARQHYHSDVASLTETTHSSNANYQPVFTRHQYGLSIESPLSSHIAALLTYSEIRSYTPRYDTTRFPEKHDYKQSNQNILLKLSSFDISNFKSSLTFVYAPFERDGAMPARRNGDYKIEGGGYRTTLDSEGKLSFGTLNLLLSYKHDDQNRDGTSDRIFLWRNSFANNYANWGTSNTATATAQEGVLGDYNMKKNALGLKPTLTFNTFGPANFRNTIKIGGEISYTDIKRTYGGYRSYQWNASAPLPTEAGPLNPDAVGDKENAVITGEQWLNRMLTVPPSSKGLSATSAAAFVQDTMQIERLALRPGLRLSYDDITKNTDISPRFLANVDVMKNGILNLSVGVSRYYGDNIVRNYLYNHATATSSYQRTSWDAPWVSISPGGPGTPRGLGDLKTPYSDEFSIAGELNMAKTNFRLEAVKRNHRDQLRSIQDPDGVYARIYTNAGKSNYEGLSFEIEKSLDFGYAGKHNLLLSLTWSQTESNSRDVDAASEEYESNIYSPTYAIYNGQTVFQDTLPANNYNSPWVVTLRDSMRFFNNRLRLFNTLRFEKGTEGLLQIGGYDIAPDGLRMYRYIDYKYADTFLYDLSLEYDLLKYRGNTVTMRVDILNALDRKNVVNTTLSSTSHGYIMGRQFIASIEYRF